MNQAEYRLHSAEVGEAELVLMATPSEQAHFGPVGDVFALCYGMARRWGVVDFEVGQGVLETIPWLQRRRVSELFQRCRAELPRIAPNARKCLWR